MIENQNSISHASSDACAEASWAGSEAAKPVSAGQRRESSKSFDYIYMGCEKFEKPPSLPPLIVKAHAVRERSGVGNGDLDH